MYLSAGDVTHVPLFEMKSQEVRVGCGKVHAVIDAT